MLDLVNAAPDPASRVAGFRPPAGSGCSEQAPGDPVAPPGDRADGSALAHWAGGGRVETLAEGQSLTGHSSFRRVHPGRLATLDIRAAGSAGAHGLPGSHGPAARGTVGADG